MYVLAKVAMDVSVSIGRSLFHWGGQMAAMGAVGAMSFSTWLQARTP